MFFYAALDTRSHEQAITHTELTQYLLPYDQAIVLKTIASRQYDRGRVLDQIATGKKNITRLFAECMTLFLVSCISFALTYASFDTCIGRMTDCFVLCMTVAYYDVTVNDFDLVVSV
jgi:hypothetical protein